MIITVILVFFMVISVNRRLFRYFGSYSGISVIPVILVNRRTASALSNRQNCACARKTLQHNEDGRTAPGVCGNGSVPLSHSGNVVTRIGIHTHIGNINNRCSVSLISRLAYIHNRSLQYSMPRVTE